jgi:ubiquinone/menaquinone biosynthesis C-methylase UbiE
MSIFTASLPEIYENVLVRPLFRPFAAVMLDRVKLRAGDTLLDVACGTGAVARLAKETVNGLGRVVGLDASPAMLAVASRVAPDIEWREGDAAKLPFAAGETFDVVVCHHGVQFFPDKAGAARELRRVLAPGGRAAVAAWLPVPEIPFVRDLNAVAERHFGPVMDARHSFGDPRALEALLKDAGFRDVAVETVARSVKFGPDVDFARLNTMALAAMSPAAKALSDEQRAKTVDAIVAESAGVVQRYRDGAGIAFDLITNLATARG